MMKIATLGAAAVFAALTFTAATAPAQAGGMSFGLGGLGGHDSDFGVEFEIEPEDFIVEEVEEVDEDSDLSDHVAWCSERYQTYNEETDMYFYAPGKQRRCVSPG